jgi:hypothetical protein
MAPAATPAGVPRLRTAARARSRIQPHRPRIGHLLHQYLRGGGLPHSLFGRQIKRVQGPMAAQNGDRGSLKSEGAPDAAGLEGHNVQPRSLFSGGANSASQPLIQALLAKHGGGGLPALPTVDGPPKVGPDVGPPDLTDASARTGNVLGALDYGQPERPRRRRNGGDQVVARRQRSQAARLPRSHRRFPALRRRPRSGDAVRGRRVQGRHGRRARGGDQFRRPAPP